MESLYLGGDSIGVQGEYIWFACHEYGNFASHYPYHIGRGKKKQESTTEVDEVVDRFQRDIFLVSSLSSTIQCMGT
jgi:hypothetical protein